MDLNFKTIFDGFENDDLSKMSSLLKDFLGMLDEGEMKFIINSLEINGSASC